MRRKPSVSDRTGHKSAYKPKKPKKKGNKSTVITSEELQLSKSKERNAYNTKGKRKTRNLDDMTINYAALGDDKGRLNSAPFTRTKTIIKRKYYKQYGNK